MIDTQPPKASDRGLWIKKLGWQLPYSKFISEEDWDDDDVLRLVYEKTSRDMGRNFPYPADAKKD